MGAFKDLTGQRFGRLVVVERAEDYVSPSGHHLVKWHCKCDCGNEIDTVTASLKLGKTTSCGCYRNEISKKVNTKDLSEQRFGRLTAMYLVETNTSGVLWHCKCDCGNEKDIRSHDLTSGNTKSCGCLAKEGNNLKHGGARTGKFERLYRVWERMKERCNNPNSKAYDKYGGRGIKVCDEWLDYNNFRKWSLLNGYDKDAAFRECTIDRIDNNKGYSPDNCRWVDQKAQNNNYSRNRIIEYNGESHNLAQWSEITGLPYYILYNRVRRGYTVEELFEIPVGGKRKDGVCKSSCTFTV